MQITLATFFWATILLLIVATFMWIKKIGNHNDWTDVKPLVSAWRRGFFFIYYKNNKGDKMVHSTDIKRMQKEYLIDSNKDRIYQQKKMDDLLFQLTSFERVKNILTQSNYLDNIREPQINELRKLVGGE